MAVATWPTTLPPAPQIRSYEEKSPNNLIRTEMDVGPAKTRRRTTAGVRPHRLLFHMTQAQVEIFDQFIGVILADCALPFDFVHPRTGDTVRFKVLPPATYTLERTNADGGPGVWFVAIDVEQQPG